VSKTAKNHLEWHNMSFGIVKTPDNGLLVKTPKKCEVLKKKLVAKTKAKVDFFLKISIFWSHFDPKM